MTDFDKRYLHVPYEDKNLAKNIGAQWDPIRRQWWVPMTVPLKYLSKWKPEKKSYF